MLFVNVVTFVSLPSARFSQTIRLLPVRVFVSRRYQLDVTYGRRAATARTSS